jgi:hypothetical protein
MAYPPHFFELRPPGPETAPSAWLQNPNLRGDKDDQINNGVFEPYKIVKGPNMQSSANNTKFVIYTENSGSWPQVCSFEVDNENNKLVMCTTKWPNPDSSSTVEQVVYRCKLPWGFLIGKEDSEDSWKITAIIKRDSHIGQSPFQGESPFQMRTDKVWSASTKAWSSLVSPQGPNLIMTNFVEWAVSRCFETILL